MKMIPPVSVDLLLLADRKVAEDHEVGLPPDPTVSIVSALHGKCKPKEMIAIERRLVALANLIVRGDGKAWTVNVEGKEYTLVHGALIRAAAIAPLTETKMMNELRFGSEILDIALRDVEPDGTA
jgi:hypothetical protein